MGILGYMLSFFSIFLFLFRVGRGIDGLTEGLSEPLKRLKRKEKGGRRGRRKVGT